MLPKQIDAQRYMQTNLITKTITELFESSVIFSSILFSDVSVARVVALQ